MFTLSGLLSEIVLNLIESLLPLAIIALIISLFVRSSSNAKTRSTRVAQAAPSQYASKQNNATATNILLYVGSALIVGPILLLVRDQQDIMPIILMLISILTYAAGIILYRTVDYLRPVATAFTYTAIVLFPFWHYAFNELHVPNNAALFISTLITLFAYIGATVGIESRISGWLSYIWLIFTGWTLANLIDSHTLLTYAFFIWPLIAAIFPTICWSCRVKWLPVAYRKATKFFAQWLTPIFALFTLLTIATPNIASECPALRIIASSLAVAISLIGWLANKKDRVLLVSLRIYLHMLILMIVADATNYSLHFGKAAASDRLSTVAQSIGWSDEVWDFSQSSNSGNEMIINCFPYEGYVIPGSGDETIPGDINGDNKVNISDVMLLINYLSNGSSADINLDAADYNGEGGITISDAIDMVNHILNNAE
jgi:hypothetical protein